MISSSCEKLEKTRYDSSEPASLPPYPYHDNLETLAEASVPNSPQSNIGESNGSRTFIYESHRDGIYGSQIVEVLGNKEVRESVDSIGRSTRNPANGNGNDARDTLRRSNSDNRDYATSHEHPYENVRFQRSYQRSGLYSTDSGESPSNLSRTIADTRPSDHPYENVLFQKNSKSIDSLEDSSCFENINIPRVTPRKRTADFKLGGQVTSYSSASSGSASLLKKSDEPLSSLDSDAKPAKKTSQRINSRSIANISTSSASNFKPWHVSIRNFHQIIKLISTLYRYSIYLLTIAKFRRGYCRPASMEYF